MISEKIVEFSKKHPTFVFLCIAVFLGISVYGMTKLWINNDLLSFLPPNDPEVKLFKEIDRKFKANKLGFVIIGVKEGSIFNPDVLKDIKKMSEMISDVDGVSSVTSILNYMDIKPTPWGVEIRDLFPEGAEGDPEKIKEIEHYVLEEKPELFTGRIVSKDGKYTILMVRFLEDVRDDVVAARIEKLIKRNFPSRAYVIQFGGLPFSQNIINRTVRCTMLKLIPVIVVLVALTLFYIFRTPKGIVLPLWIVGLSALFTLGLSGLAGVPITLASNIIPVLIIALGVDYAIHFYHHYIHSISPSVDSGQALSRAVKVVGPALFLAFITTSVGFGSFVVSDLNLMRNFGLFTALGIGFIYLLTLSLSPAFLVKFPVHRAEIEKSGGIHIKKLAHNLAVFIQRYKSAIIVASVLLGIVAVSGIPLIKIEANYMNYFPRSHPVRKAVELLGSVFSGSLPYEFYFKGDVKDPVCVRFMFLTEALMESNPRVGGVNSLASLLAEVNYNFYGNWALPETIEQVEQLMMPLAGRPEVERIYKQNEALVYGMSRAADTGLARRLAKQGKEWVRRLSGKYHRVYLGDDPVYVRGRNLEDCLFVFKCMFEKNGIKFSEEEYREKLIKFQKAPFTLSTEEVASFLYSYLNSEEVGLAASWSVCRNIALSTRSFSKKDIQRALKLYYPEDADWLSDELSFLLLKEAKKRSIDRFIKENLPSEFDRGSLKKLRAALWIAISEWAPAKGGSVAFDVKISGYPVVHTIMNDRILRSQVSSLCLTFVVILLILLVQFRSFKVAFIGLTPIVLAVLLNFAAMGYAGIELTPVTAFIGAVTIGLGVDYTVHFSTRLKKEIEAGNPAALETTLNQTGVAMMGSALTDIMGFLVLLLADLTTLRSFGFLLALTIFVSASGALTILPAFLLKFRVFGDRR